MQDTHDLARLMNFFTHKPIFQSNCATIALYRFVFEGGFSKKEEEEKVKSHSIGWPTRVSF